MWRTLLKNHCRPNTGLVVYNGVPSSANECKSCTDVMRIHPTFIISESSEIFEFHRWHALNKDLGLEFKRESLIYVVVTGTMALGLDKAVTGSGHGWC